MFSALKWMEKERVRESRPFLNIAVGGWRNHFSLRSKTWAAAAGVLLVFYPPGFARAAVSSAPSAPSGISADSAAQTPLSALISRQEFEALAAELSQKVNLFREAWAVDPSAEFFGGTTRDYLYWLRGKLSGLSTSEQLERKIAELRAERMIDVRDFIIGDSDVDLVSAGIRLDAGRYGVKKIDPINPDRFDPQTDMGQNEILQGYIPVEKIRLRKQGFVRWEGFGDGLGEILDAHPSVHFPDPEEFSRTYYAQQRINHPILLVIRYLRTLGINYYRLHGRDYPEEQLLFSAVDPETASSIRKIVADAQNKDFKKYLGESRLVQWFNASVKKAFRSYTNPTATHLLFKKFGLDVLIGMYPEQLEPINQYLFAAHRDPGRVEEHLAEFHVDKLKFFLDPKEEFPDSKIYHGTKTEEGFRAILFQGILPSSDGSAGPGLYAVTRKDIGFAARHGGALDRVVEFEVRPDARVVDITSGEGLRVFQKFGKSESEFAEYFGVDIIHYPYDPKAYVIKNSSAIGKALGHMRQPMSYSMLIKVAEGAKTYIDALPIFNSADFSGFTTGEILFAFLDSPLKQHLVDILKVFEREDGKRHPGWVRSVPLPDSREYLGLVVLFESLGELHRSGLSMQQTAQQVYFKRVQEYLFRFVDGAAAIDKPYLIAELKAMGGGLSRRGQKALVDVFDFMRKQHPADLLKHRERGDWTANIIGALLALSTGASMFFFPSEHVGQMFLGALAAVALYGGNIDVIHQVKKYNRLRERFDKARRLIRSVKPRTCERSMEALG